MMKNESNLICNKINLLKLFTKSILILLFIIPFAVYAQKQIVINGNVKDENGRSIAGVEIKNLSTSKTVISGNDGNFRIQVDNSKVKLRFSNIGFENLEVQVGTNTTFNIVLKQKVSQLDEVVVVGYGVSKRRDLITSVGKADLKSMTQAPVQSYDQMLAGRVAGVVVTSSDGQPGSASNITIRGASVSQSTSPLYIIDGFPIENMDMNSLNPNDIESIEILKDPSSVSIYGSRGSNGVVLITTKMGNAGLPKITYRINQNIQNITKKMDLMSPYQFVKLQLELDAFNSTPATPSTRFSQIYLNPNTDLNYYRAQPGLGFDWQNLLYQTGKSQDHSLNVSGGNDNTHYNFSGSYFDQSGIIINTGMHRITGRFSLDQKITSKLKSSFTASFSNSKNFGTIPATGSAGGVVQGIWQYRPTNGIGNQNITNNLFDSTSLQDFLSGTISNLADNLINPLLQAKNEYRSLRTNTVYTNANLNYAVLKNVNIKISGGYSSTELVQEQFYNSQTQQGNLIKNYAGAIANTNGINGNIQTSLAENFSSSNVITYNNNFKTLHHLDLLSGFEYTFGRQKGTKFGDINIPQATEYLGILSLNTGTPSVASLPSYTQNQLYSFFGRANYNYASKYYIMGAIREDGSSRFAPGHQWGYFPSAAAGWAFSEEKFFNNLKSVINYGKIRLSYGETGNNRSGDFGYLSQFGSIQNAVGAYWNNNPIGGIQPYFFGNNALTWETTKGTDLGLNFELFKSRVSIEAVYYNKTTTNFLLAVNVPQTSGYGGGNGNGTQYQNSGSISNKGIEFTLNTINVVTKNFKWSTNFNIAFNQSKVLSLANSIENIKIPWSLYGSATAWVTKVGGPVSQFYGYQWGGVYQYADFIKQSNGTYVLKQGIPTYASNVQPGDPKYKDVNGDGVVDANDQTTLGSPLPIHTGGLNNDFTYKNWSLNVFFQWTYGNKILNANRIVFESTGGYFMNGNQFASYDNRWSPTNPTNDLPRARYNSKGDAGSNNPRPTDRVIEDGSFLRLKTISLGYNLPNYIIKKLPISSLRFNLSAQNIFTWTKYSGMDPEVSTFRASNPSDTPFGGSNTGSSSIGGAGYSFVQPSSGYSALAGGYDYTPYPRSLILNFGINVTF